jgi:excisionase family DNA binding protein
MPDESDLLTTSEAAKHFRVARSTITRWIRLGQLPAVRIPSGHWRVRRSDVERALREDQERDR